MKKKLALIIIIYSHVSFLHACTTFFINKNGQMLFGRNYDWITDAGMVCTNLKGLAKTSMKTENGETIRWVSRYGSITFNQYGKEYPTGGMNEKGLVVELMWLDETKYQGQDKRPALNVLQWIQYQLDRSATVEEVIASDSRLRISGAGVPLHYLVADASGAAATIEFLEGKMVVHKGTDLSFPVLTNSVYEQSVKEAKNKLQAKSTASSSNRYGSLERFSTACSLLQQYQQADRTTAPLDDAFSILNEVAQGEATKWSIVYDITGKKIHFTTHNHQERKSISFSAFDFSCSKPAMAFDMNTTKTGDVSAQFIPFNKEYNRRLIERSAEESRKQINISKERIEEAVLVAEGSSCKE